MTDNGIIAYNEGKLSPEIMYHIYPLKGLAHQKIVVMVVAKVKPSSTLIVIFIAKMVL